MYTRVYRPQCQGTLNTYSRATALKRQCLHFDENFVTGCTETLRESIPRLF